MAAKIVINGDAGRVIAIDKNGSRDTLNRLMDRGLDLTIAIDIEKIPGVITLQQDFLDPTKQEKITKLLPNGRADVVLRWAIADLIRHCGIF